MIFGMEVGMFIAGLVALIRGKMTLSPSKVLEGTAARLLALVMMAPLPTALCVGFVWFASVDAGNPSETRQPPGRSLLPVEVGLIVVCFAVTYGVGSFLAPAPRQPEIKRKPAPLSRPDDVDD